MSDLQKKLGQWIDAGFNVMLCGRHGVGKTTIIADVLNSRKLKWKYFSASTLDPWVDFIGIPKERADEKTGQPYIDLVRPRDFANDEVEVVVIDEFNRAHKKVTNAIMELIQFKSINGNKYENLRLIIAAINPPGEGKYDVEEMDDAVKDRFQVFYNVPYEVDIKFFIKKFGENGQKACDWWNGLDSKNDLKNRLLISPRRLEYILEAYNNNIELRDLVPKEISVDSLVKAIGTNKTLQTLKEMYDDKDVKKARKWLSNPNNYAIASPIIITNPDYSGFFLPLISKEDLSILYQNSALVRKVVLNRLDIYEEFVESLIEGGAISGAILAGANNNLESFRKKRSDIEDKVKTAEIVVDMNEDNISI